MAKTIIDYTSNGVQTVYDVTFTLGYIRREYVYVYLEGNDYETQLDYVWINSTQIQLNSLPADGEVFHVRRVIPRDELVIDYTDTSPLRGGTLNKAFSQALMILEEYEDGFITLEDVYTIIGDVLITGDLTVEGTTNVTTDSQVGTSAVSVTHLEDTLQNLQDELDALYAFVDGVNVFTERNTFNGDFLITGVNTDVAIKGFLNTQGEVFFDRAPATREGVEFVHEGEFSSVYSVLRASSTGQLLWDDVPVDVTGLLYGDNVWTGSNEWSDTSTFNNVVTVSAPMNVHAPLVTTVPQQIKAGTLWNGVFVEEALGAYGGYTLELNGVKLLNTFNLTNNNSVGTESDQGPSRLGAESMMTRRAISDNYLTDIVAGTNVSIDRTNPRQPIVNATGGGGGDDGFLAVASATNNAIVANTLGYFYKWTDQNSNQPKGALVSANGGANGEHIPFGASNGTVLTSVTIKAWQVSTGTATVGAAPYVDIGFYTLDDAGWTNFGIASVPVLASGIPNVLTNNNAGGSTAIECKIEGISIAVPDGKLFGFVFLNSSATDNNINVLGHATVSITGETA